MSESAVNTAFFILGAVFVSLAAALAVILWRVALFLPLNC